MIEFLTSATFDFNKANELSEDEHKNAFIKIFEEIFVLFKEWLKNDSPIMISLKKDIVVNGMEKLSQLKGEIVYSLSVKEFYSNLRQIASALYFSENDRVVITQKADYELQIVAVMDPIYFSFSVKPIFHS